TSRSRPRAGKQCSSPSIWWALHVLLALRVLRAPLSLRMFCLRSVSRPAEPMHVQLAIGLSPDEARSSLRFSFGRQTTSEEVDFAIAAIPEVVERLRALSPRSATMVAVR